MRTVADFPVSGASVPSKELDFLGFKFSENALNSRIVEADPEFKSTKRVEALGRGLSGASSESAFYTFSKEVCVWGRGGRVWGNLTRHHSEADLGRKLKCWLSLLDTHSEDRKAISDGVGITGLGVSFASKHLRLYKPQRYGLLDDVLRQGLGIALNSSGYALFLRELRKLSENSSWQGSVGDLEAVLFVLVRQNVRSVSK